MTGVHQSQRIPQLSVISQLIYLMYITSHLFAIVGAYVRVYCKLKHASYWQRVRL